MAMNIRKVFGDPLPRLEERHIRMAFLLLTIIAVIITFLSVILRRWEFFYYSLVSLLGIFIFYDTRKRMHLQWETVVLISILAILNFAGGTYYIGTVRLYDHYFFGIRYDQFMHFVGFAVVAVALYDFIIPYLKSVKKGYILSITILLTVGASALLEIAEFIAVLTIGTTGVGDYFNNAYDLVFGLFGAIVGTVFADFALKKKRRQRR
jgi:putative membrane protein